MPDIFQPREGDQVEERKKKLRPIGRRTTKEQILNVFTPNSAIQTPAKFVGRQEALSAMITGLLTTGADLIVYGERGCGKSSLAHMLHHVASGNLELLDYYGIRRDLEQDGLLTWLIGPKKKKFRVVWTDGFGRPLDDVLRQALNRRKDGSYGAGIMAYLPTEADQLEISQKIGFDRVFKSETELKEVRLKEKPINVKEAFEIAVQRYSDSHDEDLVIVIDEFETVSDRASIAQYLKSAKRTKFALIGVAQNAVELLEQHSSVARDTHAIELQPMNDHEMRALLEVGFHVLSNFFKMEGSGVDRIITAASGSPFWCHFLAKTVIEDQMQTVPSFDAFIESGTAISIRGSDVDATLGALSSYPATRIFEEALRHSTLGDETNCRIIYALAQKPQSELYSKAVAAEVADSLKLDVELVEQTILDMLELPTSPFERRRQIRDTIAFAFRDPNFKRYVVMRKGGKP